MKPKPSGTTPKRYPSDLTRTQWKRLKRLLPLQIIENWAHIEGRVESVEPNKEHAGFVTAQVAVKAANPVPGFPNLFADAPGQTIPLNLPTEVSERLKVRPGVTLSAWVRKSRPGQAFTHPDRVEVR